MVEILLKGLSRLEYRGYDSAGIAIEGDKENEVWLALLTLVLYF
jgi:glutamine---fructose-6-phosphate transaminase (isomerizing)